MNVGAYGRRGPPCDHVHDLLSFHANDHGHAGERVCGCGYLRIHVCVCDGVHAYADENLS